jgi:hypothetical protein
VTVGLYRTEIRNVMAGNVATTARHPSRFVGQFDCENVFGARVNLSNSGLPIFERLENSRTKLLPSHLSLIIAFI